jgi:hypothetical protein
MIDFDSLVLGPAQEIFARPIIVTPLNSQPGAPAYAARGIWSDRASDLMLDDNGVISVQNPTLGVRLSEFTVMPVKGDRINVPAYMSLPALGLAEIDDTDKDGQGGAVWSLKILNPHLPA